MLSTAQKIVRLQSYVKANRSGDIKAACKAARVHYKTVFALLDVDRTKAENSTTFKNGKIDEILEFLPHLRRETEFKSYRTFLAQKGLSIDTQRVLEKNAGFYRVITNIPREALEFDEMKIQVLKTPFFPIFNLKARGFHHSSVTEYNSDGYAILDGNRIAFTGLSAYLNTFIIVRNVIDPASEILHGVGTFENRETGMCYTSELIMYARNARLPEQTLRNARDSLTEKKFVAF